MGLELFVNVCSVSFPAVLLMMMNQPSTNRHHCFSQVAGTPPGRPFWGLFSLLLLRGFGLQRAFSSGF